MIWSSRSARLTSLGRLITLAAASLFVLSAGRTSTAAAQAGEQTGSIGGTVVDDQGTPLSDDEIRRIASYQKTFNEMTRGERFVQEVLRGKAQTRARWVIGAPGMLVALAGLLWLTRRHFRVGTDLGN